MNVRNIFVITTILCLLTALFPSSPEASGGPRFRVGHVAAKGLILSDEGNPYWVEYDADGNVVHLIGEVKDELIDSWLMPGHDFRLQMAGFAEIEAKNSGHREILYKDEYLARNFIDAAGNPLAAKPTLLPSTRTVVVRTGDVLYSAGDFILLQSPLDLKQARPIADDIRALLINDEGLVVHSAKVNIGYRVAFYTPSDYNPAASGKVDMKSDGNYSLWGYKNYQDKLWGPVQGVLVESTLGRRGAYSEADGRYAVSYYIPPCPGFAWFYDSMMLVSMKYQSFNPNAKKLYNYYSTMPDYDACSGFGDFPPGYSLAGLAAQMFGMTIDMSIEGRVLLRKIEFPIDLAMLSGEADVRNLDGAALPQGQETSYSYNQIDFQPVIPEVDLDGDGVKDVVQLDPETGQLSFWFGGSDPVNDPADLTRQADYTPDFSHQGLVKQISHADLRNTDTFIYRVSNGQLFSARNGLLGSEAEEPYFGDVSNTTDTTIHYRQTIRGPRMANKYDTPLEKWQARTNVNPELRGWNADHIRTGEQLKVVMINRATGYIGSSIATYGANTQAGGVISFTPPKIHMQPPNLKIKVERKSIIEAGLTAGDEKIHTIGFEGAGLTSDEVIAITTEWFEHDGSPLPEDLPGYTGRLAKVVDVNTLGQAGNQIANFPIQPGRNMVVVKLPQKQIDNAHYYVHVSGEAMEGSPDFSSAADFATIGAGDGALEYRPKHYVPVRVPVYDEALTKDAEEIRKKAITQGADPAAIPQVDPVYQWPYRPEMQFSLFDLQIQGRDRINDPTDDQSPEKITIRDANGTITDLENYNELFSILLSDDPVLRPMLERFGPARELVFHLGNQEIKAIIDQNGQIRFQPINPHGLRPEDWLTLSLYQNGDEANSLFEYKLDLEVLKVELETEYRPERKFASQLFADEPATLKATTKPVGRKVKWSIVSKDKGVLIAKFDEDTGEIRLHPESEPDTNITVRATDSFNPYVYHDLIINCQVCAEEEAGGKKTRLGSVDATFSLGVAGEGEAAGKLYIAADTISRQLYAPKTLQLSSTVIDATSSIIKDPATNAIRQLLAPQVFVNVEVVDAASYQLQFYKSSEVAGKTVEYGENGLKTELYQLQAGAAPYVEYTIANPDAAAKLSTRLKITETRPNTAPVVDEYQWLEGENAWILSKAGGTVIEKEQTQDDGQGTATVLKTVADSQNIASTTRTISKTFAWGEEVVTSVLDPSGKQLTTTHQYYEIKTEPGYGQLKSTVNPDGSWVRYTYDDKGRSKEVVHSWLGAGPGATANQAHAVTYDYTPVDLADSGRIKDADRPRTVTETILGTVVGKTYHSYRKTESGEQVVIEERCAAPDSGFGAAGNQRTTTTFAADGKTRSVVNSDGRQDSYTYAGRIEEVIHGTVDAPAGIAGKTTRDVTITDTLGHTLRQESYVYTGSGYEPTGWSYNVLDDLGRVKETHYANGTMVEPPGSSCCSLVKTASDVAGNITDYFYDSLGRKERQEQQGLEGIITTAFTYDAAGRTLNQSMSGSGLSQTSTNTYDSAGRLKTVTDPAGLTTIYQYSADGLTTTLTHPGGATEITTRYSDGQIQSVTGTGVIPSFYEYTINPDGSRTTKVSLGSATSPRWEKSTTDSLGRTIRSERPGYTGSLITENFYNDKGRLIKTTTTGQPDQLYEYDALGNQFASGLDVDGNGVLNRASTDRISETINRFAQYDNSWWQETVQQTYAGESSATPTIIASERTQLSDLTTASYTVSEDIHGNKTISSTSIDRATQTVINTTDYPDSDIDGQSVTTRGLTVSATDKTGLTTTFAYDALGRRTGTTDPRTGTAITHYNGKGQVEYQEDAAGNRTGFNYDPATGRLAAQTSPDNTTIYSAYNNLGQVTHTWGSGGYPVRSVYDGYGQRTELHTFRAESGWDGASWPTTTGQADVTKWNFHEATGLLLAKEDAEGNAVNYTYTPSGQLQKRTWAREAGAVFTTYDYQATGELKTIDYSDATPDIAFAYDRLGRQQTITDGLGSRTFAYNENLQPESEVISGLYNTTLTRTYDTIVPGRNNGFTLDTGYQISYGFDNTGRFASLDWQHGAASGNATYGYLANSQLLETITSHSAGGTGITTFTYEAKRNQKTGVSNSHNTQLISHYQYDYDTLGRRTNVKNSGFAFATPGFNLYNYNNRSEVTGSSRYQGGDLADLSNPVGQEKRAYQYDAIGNRDTAALGDGQSKIDIDYTVNKLNQYEQVTGGTITSPSYDADGNLTGYTKDGKALTLTFNGENRLIAIAPGIPAAGDIKSEYLYDYQSRRVRKDVSTWDGSQWQASANTLFVYDGWNLIAELDGSGTPEAVYVWGLDLSQSLQGAGGIGGLVARVDVSEQKTHHYCYDANGNVGQLVDVGDGELAVAYEFDPYGNLIASGGDFAGVNPFRFSTKYFDGESGLYYYGYRFYSPELGRWVSRDPIEEKGGLNLYGFVQNTPVNLVDHRGLFSLKDAQHDLVKRGVVPDKNDSLYVTYSDSQIFQAWLNLEKRDKSWLNNLPIPPACLKKQGSSYVLPTGYSSNWKQPALIKFKKYHPKGTWEIRTQSANAYGAGNQAVYDDKGLILTGGYSAGSADRRQADSPAVTVMKFGQGGHIKEDVEPFDLALDLDNGYGTHIQSYLSVRPTIVPEGANVNVLDPF